MVAYLLNFLVLSDSDFNITKVFVFEVGAQLLSTGAAIMFKRDESLVEKKQFVKQFEGPKFLCSLSFYNFIKFQTATRKQGKNNFAFDPIYNYAWWLLEMKLSLFKSQL